MYKQDLPFVFYLSSNFWALLGVFVSFLVALDLALVRWLRLNIRAWKYVDYVWLGVAALGLLSAAAEARRQLATNLLEGQRVFTSGNYDALHRQVEWGTGPAICRKFVRTDSSPHDLEEAQMEFDRVCDFYKTLLASLPKDISPRFQRVEIPSSLQKPKVREKMLQEDFLRLDRYFSEYDQSRKDLELMVASQGRLEPEVSATLLGPLLLAFALALRITKVTGELKN